MVTFAINGFGRIGKCVLRALLERQDPDLQCVAINVGCGDIATHAHLLKHDSNHGLLADVKVIDDQTLGIGDKRIAILKEKDPSKVNWEKYGVSLVLECSGAFTKRDLAAQHLASGAKKVIVSAPCDGADATIILGVNHDKLKVEHQVISIGSCTTNCLAPIAKALNDALIIEQGFMTTVHAYTNDQNLLDATHKDLRRARAAAQSMIPSSTGAAKALGLVLPELAGKLDGVAIRVPVPNVSLVDLKVTTKKSTSVDEVNAIIKQAAKLNPQVLGYIEEELVSIDFNHSSFSSAFDATQTKVVGNNFVRVAAWYDNEWGFSNRMLDLTKMFGKM